MTTAAQGADQHSIECRPSVSIHFETSELKTLPRRKHIGDAPNILALQARPAAHRPEDQAASPDRGYLPVKTCTEYLRCVICSNKRPGPPRRHGHNAGNRGHWLSQSPAALRKNTTDELLQRRPFGRVASTLRIAKLEWMRETPGIAERISLWMRSNSPALATSTRSR